MELLVESWRLSVRVVFSSSPPSARAVFANVATLTIALLHSRCYRLNLRQAPNGIDVNKLHYCRKTHLGDIQSFNAFCMKAPNHHLTMSNSVVYLMQFHAPSYIILQHLDRALPTPNYPPKHRHNNSVAVNYAHCTHMRILSRRRHPPPPIHSTDADATRN